MLWTEPYTGKGETDGPKASQSAVLVEGREGKIGQSEFIIGLQWVQRRR